MCPCCKWVWVGWLVVCDQQNSNAVQAQATGERKYLESALSLREGLSWALSFIYSLPLANSWSFLPSQHIFFFNCCCEKKLLLVFWACLPTSSRKTYTQKCILVCLYCSLCRLKIQAEVKSAAKACFCRHCCWWPHHGSLSRPHDLLWQWFKSVCNGAAPIGSGRQVLWLYLTRSPWVCPGTNSEGLGLVLCWFQGVETQLLLGQNFFSRWNLSYGLSSKACCESHTI